MSTEATEAPAAPAAPAPASESIDAMLFDVLPTVSNEAKEEPAAAPAPAVKAEEKAPEKPAPLAGKFATIARKEREALDRQRELDRREAEMKAREEKYKPVEEAVSKKDAIAALEAMGLSFDEALEVYTSRLLVEDNSPEARLARLEAEKAEEKKAAEERAAKEAAATTEAAKKAAAAAAEQATAKVTADIQQMIDANAEQFDRVSRNPEAAAAIYDSLNTMFQEEPEGTDPVKFIETKFPVAAKILEDYFESEYQRLYAPRKKATKTDPETLDKALSDSYRPRTLSNETISGQTRPVAYEASTPDAALADALGTLKRR